MYCVLRYAPWVLLFLSTLTMGAHAEAEVHAAKEIVKRIPFNFAEARAYFEEFFAEP